MAIVHPIPENQPAFWNALLDLFGVDPRTVLDGSLTIQSFGPHKVMFKYEAAQMLTLDELAAVLRSVQMDEVHASTVDGRASCQADADNG